MSSLTVHGSQHGRTYDPDLGIAMALTSGLVSTVVTKGAPIFFGTPETPQERIRKRREQILQNRKRLRQRYQSAQEALSKLKSNLSLSPTEARGVIQQGGDGKRRIWSARWRTRLDDLDGGEALARLIGEHAQSIYLRHARTVLTRQALPKAVGAGAALLGIGGIAYAFSQSEDTNDE